MEITRKPIQEIPGYTDCTTRLSMIVRGNDEILGAVQDIDAQLTSEDEDDVVQARRTRRL